MGGHLTRFLPIQCHGAGLIDQFLRKRPFAHAAPSVRLDGRGIRHDERDSLTADGVLQDICIFPELPEYLCLPVSRWPHEENVIPDSMSSRDDSKDVVGISNRN